MSRTSSARCLNAKLDVRAATLSPGTRVSSVMISSTIPSQKYSWSRSGLISANGSTATDGSARRVRVRRVRARLTVLRLHDGDETKTAPLNGANHGLTVAVVACDRARLAHDLRERGVRDDRARPKLLEQLVFVDDSIAILDQIDEQVESFRLRLDELAACLDLAQAGIHFAVTEAIDRAPFERSLRFPRGRHAASASCQGAQNVTLKRHLQ